MRVYKQHSSHIIDYDDNNGGLPIKESVSKLVFLPRGVDEEDYLDWVASQNDDVESMSATFIGDIDELDVIREEDSGIRHNITIIGGLDEPTEFQVVA